MKKFVNTIWTIAVILDFWSTIIQADWRVEENPLIRYIWHYGGMLGMVLITLFFYLLVMFIPHLVYQITEDKKMQNIAYTILIPLIVFKIMIALTNFNLIPYYWTGWFHY